MKTKDPTKPYSGKTAISMPEDLYNAVLEYAGDKPFSTTVCDLLRISLAGVTPVVIPSINKVILSQEEMDDIRKRLSSLEVWKESVVVIPEVIPSIETGSELSPHPIPQKNDSGITGVIPTREEMDYQATLSSKEDVKTKEVIPEDELEQSVSPIPHDDSVVIPEVIPEPSILPTPHEEEIPVPGKDEKIQITPEIRQQIISHLDALNTSGMNDSHIAKEAGFNKSLISLIRKADDDLKQQKALKVWQYQALVAVAPTTS